MKYIDEYRSKDLIKIVADGIKETADPRREYRFMEVCGTHTMAIARFGLKSLLPSNIKLLSGPGCPVCVTATSFIDKAIVYAGLKDVLLTTFGDMVKVPGSKTSLEKTRAERGNLRVIYSAIDALKIAVENPRKKIIFLGVGFETTAPTIAATIKEAKKKKINNFYVLSGHKIIPPALEALVEDKRIRLNGFILPAHVSAIVGSRPYGFIVKDYNISSVIAGFEPLDIMQGILMLVKQIEEDSPKVEIQYQRVVKPSGNKLAQRAMEEVFKIVDSEWRGLGIIPKSGLAIKGDFSGFDAEKSLKIKPVRKSAGKKGCICGEVLKGLKEPRDCRLFGKTCTPEYPVGPCMVSSEGTCAARYAYG